MTTLAKPKTLRDPKHLAFIRQLPCVKCNRVPTQAAHIRKFGGGGIGHKPSDARCVPLCVECHTHQHSAKIGELVFWGGIDGVWRAIDLAEKLHSVTGNWKEACTAIIEYRRGA